MRGSASNGSPGARTRRGPAERNGLTRSEYTGSVSTFRPANCTRNVMWLTKVRAVAPGASVAGSEGRARFSTHCGQGFGRRVRCQREKSAKDLPAPPVVLRNTRPSK
jgi:hypothetical protein